MAYTSVFLCLAYRYFSEPVRLFLGCSAAVSEQGASGKCETVSDSEWANHDQMRLFYLFWLNMMW